MKCIIQLNKHLSIFIKLQSATYFVLSVTLLVALAARILTMHTAHASNQTHSNNAFICEILSKIQVQNRSNNSLPPQGPLDGLLW